MADELKGTQGTIDMLIGLDLYWTIVTGDIKQGVYGPVAISSKLGWLLSGPVTVSAPCIHSSHLIIQGSCSLQEENSEQLLSALKDFWETEAIGISDTSQTTTNDECFLEEINFVSGRYEVKLPWKEEGTDIPNHYQLSLN